MGIQPGLIYPAGVWMAYYPGEVSCVPFATEVEALRHAVAYSMHVRYAEFGDAEWMNGPEKVAPVVSPPSVCR